jgi:hypothetical protein
VRLPSEVYRKVVPSKDAELETDMEGLDECNA